MELQARTRLDPDQPSRHPQAGRPAPSTTPDRRHADPAGATRTDHNRVEPTEVLTARQIEVLGLVCAGCTNRQIARRCGISERTVEKHLEAIFERLGVSSRTSAALRRESTQSDRLAQPPHAN